MILHNKISGSLVLLHGGYSARDPVNMKGIRCVTGRTCACTQGNFVAMETSFCCCVKALSNPCFVCIQTHATLDGRNPALPEFLCMVLLYRFIRGNARSLSTVVIVFRGTFMESLPDGCTARFCAETTYKILGLMVLQ